MQGTSQPPRPPRWLGPGELARRLGISVKALRVYERAGLVAPARREGGWRSYGPADIARLHEILALKSLGLSLAEVKQVLEAPASSLERTLGIQQRHLAAEVAAAQRRLAAVNAARRRLEEEGSLGIDELLVLINQTAASPPISADQVEAIIHGLAREQEPNDDLARFRRDIEARIGQAGIDHAGFERSLSELVADASRAAEGDPAGEEGRALAGRWLALTAALGPDFARRPGAFGDGVSEFAALLTRDSGLAAALAFLKGAVAAHGDRPRPTDSKDRQS